MEDARVKPFCETVMPVAVVVASDVEPLTVTPASVVFPETISAFMVVVARVKTPLNVLSPAKVCVEVEINPLAVADASGKLKVCVLPLEVIPTSVPVVPIAKNCVDVARPFSEPSLLLKVVQSAVVNNPRFNADALGKLKVKEFVEVEIAKSVPIVPVKKVKFGPFAPLMVVVALPPPDCVIH